MTEDQNGLLVCKNAENDVCLLRSGIANWDVLCLYRNQKCPVNPNTSNRKCVGSNCDLSEDRKVLVCDAKGCDAAYHPECLDSALCELNSLRKPDGGLFTEEEIFCPQCSVRKNTAKRILKKLQRVSNKKTVKSSLNLQSDFEFRVKMRLWHDMDAVTETRVRAILDGTASEPLHEQVIKSNWTYRDIIY